MPPRCLQTGNLRHQVSEYILRTDTRKTKMIATPQNKRRVNKPDSFKNNSHSGEIVCKNKVCFQIISLVFYSQTLSKPHQNSSFVLNHLSWSKALNNLLLQFRITDCLTLQVSFFQTFFSKTISSDHKLLQSYTILKLINLTLHNSYKIHAAKRTFYKNAASKIQNKFVHCTHAHSSKTSSSNHCHNNNPHNKPIFQ